MDIFIRGYIEDNTLRSEKRDVLFEKITAMKVTLKKMHNKYDNMTIEQFEKDKEKLKQQIDDRNNKLNTLIKSFQEDISGISENQFNEQKKNLKENTQSKKRDQKKKSNLKKEE